MFPISQAKMLHLISHIQTGFDNLSLSNKQQYDLALQLTYVLSLAKEHPVQVKGNKYNLGALNLDQLSDLFLELVNQTSHPLITKQNKLKAQLNLLAVLREIYWQCNAVIIRESELLSIIIAITHPQDTTLIELQPNIQTQNSLILLAVMQWAGAWKVTVDLCLDGDKEVEDNCFMYAEQLFQCLAVIPNAYIWDGSLVESYKKGGINYSNCRGLSLLRAEMEAEGVCLQVNKPEEQNLLYLIADDSLNTELLSTYKQQSPISVTFVNLEEQSTCKLRDNPLLDIVYKVPPVGEAVDQFAGAAMNDKDAEYRVAQKDSLVSYQLRVVSILLKSLMKQCNDWVNFLHLIYPSNEWPELNNELTQQHQELSNKWSAGCDKLCEKLSDDPWDEDNLILKRAELDTFLSELQDLTELLWDEQYALFKEKVNDRVTAGSINALRYDYLSSRKFKEQLHLNRVQEALNRKALQKEQKVSKRQLASALDVNAAMLAYSDLPLEQYKLDFSEHQLRLLIELTERSTLDLDTRESFLKDDLRKADSFPAFEQCLIQFSKSYRNEKHRLQPVILELARVYGLSGKAESTGLKELKSIYFTQVALELQEDLKNSLSWAMDENRGLGFWLERTAVQTAAEDILVAVAALKKAVTSAERRSAIKNLYTVLVSQQAQLKDLWILSLGHENTRDLINKTLASLDALTLVGLPKDHIDSVFIQECKEEAHYALMDEQFRAVISRLEMEHQELLSNSAEWQNIKQQIKLIQEDNKTIYSFDELYYFLSRATKNLSQTNTPLLKCVVKLRGELRSIWHQFSQKNPALISQSKYFAAKEQSMKHQLNEMLKLDATKVQLKPGQVGVHQYFDLIIESNSTHPALASFTRYEPKGSFLDERCRGQLAAKNDLQTWLSDAQRQKQQLNHSGILDINLFDESYHKDIELVNSLREVLKTKRKSLKHFGSEEISLFNDRRLVPIINFDYVDFNVELETISRIQDLTLKNEFIALFEKMNAKKQRTSLFGALVNIIIPSESVDDWRYQFNELQKRPAEQLQRLLQARINETLASIRVDLDSSIKHTEAELQKIPDSLAFLTEKMAEEQQNSRVMTRRFNTLDELCTFENRLRACRASLPAVDVDNVAGGVEVREEHAAGLSISV